MREKFLTSLIRKALPETALRVAAELEVDRDMRRREAHGEPFTFAFDASKNKRHWITVNWFKSGNQFLLDGELVNPEENPDRWAIIQEGLADVRERDIQTHVDFLKP